MLKKIISALAVSSAVAVFSASGCMAANINISDTYVEGDLYIYVVDSGFIPYDSSIIINNTYVGGSLGVYQFAGDGSFIPAGNGTQDFRGRSPRIY